MKKVAIFGGTFDPPHNGHIHMMHLLREVHCLDKVYIVPANKNPFKETKTPVEERLAMCRAAFSPFGWCEVLPIEALRSGISYTIDTIDCLLKNDPLFRDGERYIMLGQEAALSLPMWREPDRLMSLVRPLVISRDLFDEKLCRKMSAPLFQALKNGWTTSSPLCLSSTEIRERIARGYYVEHLVPPSVFSFIQEHHLYKENVL